MTQKNLDSRAYWKIFKPPYSFNEQTLIVQDCSNITENIFPFKIDKQSQNSTNDENEDEDVLFIKRKLGKSLDKLISKSYKITKKESSFRRQRKQFDKEYFKGSLRLLRKCKRAINVNESEELAKNEILKKESHSKSHSSYHYIQSNSTIPSSKSKLENSSSSEDEMDPRWAQCISDTMKYLKTD